jgi:hypothetical protein
MKLHRIPVTPRVVWNVLYDTIDGVDPTHNQDVANMDAFADKLRGAGVDVQIIDATGYSHGDVNQLIGSTTDPIMTKPVTAFFERCFAKRS